MSTRTIQFTGGCGKVSEGCRNCFAIPFVHRLAHNPRVKTNYSGLVRYSIRGKGNEELEWSGRTRLFPENLDIPRKVKKPTMWFVNSMSDLFHKDIPDNFICNVITIINSNNRHIFQILTKRPERALILINNYRYLKRGLPKNLWFGVSIEDQKTADERIPILLQIPAAVRFLSIEPMLQEVNLDELPDMPVTIADTRKGSWNFSIGRIDWVIIGGESGPGARPMHLNWVRIVRDQCVAAGVPLFIKQMGSVYAKKHGMSDSKGHNIDEFPEDLRIREYPNYK